MENHLFRFEFKYLIPRYLIRNIENDLMDLGFSRDTFCATGGSARGGNAGKRYYVSSVYFETPNVADYSDKSGGFLDRKKIRARIYENTLNAAYSDKPSVWLEIKEKHDMMIWKRRFAITPNEWKLLLFSPQIAHKMIASRLNPEEQKILTEFVFWATYERRRPYVLVQYKRRAFQSFQGTERIRVTLDYDIRAQRTNQFMARPSSDVSQKGAVIEVKFREKLPWQIKFLLSKYRLRRDSYSKYSKGVEAVRRFYPIYR